jgi:Domain of unknown function (DUF5666)
MQIGRTLSCAGTVAALSTAGVLTLGGGAGAQVQRLTTTSLHGVVTSVSSDGFQILLPDTSREEIRTNNSTGYAETGSPDAVSGVAVGENVDVRLAPETSPSDTPTASRVEILLDAVRGKVMSVSDTSITLTHGKSADRTVQVTPSTKYFKGGSAASGVTDGEQVVAYGTPNSGKNPDVTAWYVDSRSGSPGASATVTVPPQQPAPTGPTSTTTSVIPSPSVTPTTPPVGPTGSGPGADPPGFNPGGPMQIGHARGGHGGRGR